MTTTSTVRPKPTEPWNDAEKKLIKERQQIVRDRIRDHILDNLATLMYTQQGDFTFHHQVNVARFALQANGKFCLWRKTWRAIAWELRFPPSAIFKHHDGRNRSGFVETVPHADKDWEFKASTLFSAPGTYVSNQEVMEFLGFASSAYGYPGHNFDDGTPHDPVWSPPDALERLGEAALRWDRTDATGWEDISEDRYIATTVWYPAMIGAGYELATDEDATLSVSAKSLTNKESIAWVLEGLEEWPNAQTFFNVVSAGVKARMDSRQLCHVNTGGQVDGFATAVDSTAWTKYRFTNYQAAVAEGKSLT